MTNKYILLPIASLAFMIFLFGCGNREGSPFTAPAPARTWNGTWASSKVVSSGTMSITIAPSGTISSGSITMVGSPCFSTSSIIDYTIAGDTVSWSSPGIGDFAGTITGASIVGTYSVTAAGACSGDAGIFSVTS